MKKVEQRQRPDADRLLQRWVDLLIDQRDAGLSEIDERAAYAWLKSFIRWKE